jgi:type IV pilus assembly protein PilM
MNFLPKASGTRPRVACEIAPEGVTAARSGEPGAPLAGIGFAALETGALAPSLKPGNVVDRLEVIAAVRKALEQVGAKANTRNADITVVIPDGACRVLLLEFDSLPNKLSEALPLVRFRLKKLLPFDADDAMVSFQVMSQSRQIVRVLAVAIPRDVLGEYESAAREAGFDPGAVLPSTLAAMAAVDEAGAALVINANSLGITAAIAREGILLLHRAVDLQAQPAGVPVNMPAALFEPPVDDAHSGVAEFARLPLVDVDDSAGEWAAQQPLPEHGRNPYADRVDDEAAVQDEDGITGIPVPHVYAPERSWSGDGVGQGGAVEGSPYAASTVLADLNAEKHFAMLDTPPLAPTAPGASADSYGVQTMTSFAPEQDEARELQVEGGALPAEAFADEIAQAVSVAAAYFEDTLGAAPEIVLSAGSLGAAGLQRILDAREMGAGLRVREVADASAFAADAATARVARGQLAGVLGAVRG